MSPRGRHRGSTLVEVLAALTLFALAGAVIASTAVVSLRSLRANAVRGRLVALAAGELAALQVRQLAAAEDERPLAEPGLTGRVARQTTVDDDATLASHRVAIAAGPPPVRVTLDTRQRMPW